MEHEKKTMLETFVRMDDIEYLFAGLILDYQINESFKYASLDTTDINRVHAMIDEYIIPQFHCLNDTQKEWLKASLSYFMLIEPDGLLRLNHDGYLPFDIPSNPYGFFEMIWYKIFPHEVPKSNPSLVRVIR